MSLIVNYASRIPSIVGMLVFIPMVHRQMGDAVYGDLMAALALGGLSSFLFGGVNMLGRRRIGEAMAYGDQLQESARFRTLCKASTLAAVIGIAVAMAVVVGDQRSLVFMAVAILPIVNGLTGALDEARAAYNEHYVTASLQLCFQLIAYSLALTLDWLPGNFGVVALVMIGPGILASLISGGSLVANRRYLLYNHGQPAWKALGEGLPIGMIDGVVMLIVNLSVVVIESHGSASSGAWYATLVRIFFLTMAPVLLTLVPLTSYIRGIWHDRDAASRVTILTIWMSVSIAYGLITALALAAGDHFYLRGVMNLGSPVSMIGVLPIYAGLATVVMFKSFAGLGYMVLRTQDLNRSFGWLLTVVVLAGALGYFWGGVFSALQLGSCLFALGTPLVMLRVRPWAAKGGSMATPLPEMIKE